MVELEVKLMYRDLIINLSIIISFLFISGQTFKHKPMYGSITNKIIGGLIAGVLGLTLMSFSIQVTDTTMMDLRTFAIILAIIYGSIISGIIAGGMIVFGRMLLFGVNISSIAAVCIVISLVIVCALISKSNCPIFRKFLYMNISNIVIVSLAFIYLINDTTLLFQALAYYGVISLFSGFVIYYLCDYIVRSNENFRQLKESAQIDFLTGLNNVRQFDATWNKLVMNAKEKNEKLSLLLIDIDHFKKINDTYGHLIGDIVLKELGGILINSSRSFDIVSRNGGEEFSVILPDCSNQQALEIGEKLRNTVEKHDFFISKTEKINITISIGIATFPETIKDTDKMLETADKCLYKAKHSGRNKVSACM